MIQPEFTWMDGYSTTILFISDYANPQKQVGNLQCERKVR